MRLADQPGWTVDANDHHRIGSAEIEAMADSSRPDRPIPCRPRRSTTSIVKSGRMTEVGAWADGDQSHRRDASQPMRQTPCLKPLGELHLAPSGAQRTRVPRRCRDAADPPDLALRHSLVCRTLLIRGILDLILCGQPCLPPRARACLRTGRLPAGCRSIGLSPPLLCPAARFSFSGESEHLRQTHGLRAPPNLEGIEEWAIGPTLPATDAMGAWLGGPSESRAVGSFESEKGGRLVEAQDLGSHEVKLASYRIRIHRPVGTGPRWSGCVRRGTAPRWRKGRRPLRSGHLLTRHS